MLDTLLIPLRVHIFLESKSKKELKIDDGKVSSQDLCQRMCSDSIFNDDYKAIRMKKCGGNQEKFMKYLQLLWMSHTKLVISYVSQYKRTQPMSQ